MKNNTLRGCWWKILQEIKREVVHSGKWYINKINKWNQEWTKRVTSF